MPVVSHSVHCLIMNKFSNLTLVKPAANDTFGALTSVDFQGVTYIFYIGTDWEIWYFTVDNAATPPDPSRPKKNGEPIKVPAQSISPGYSMLSTVSILPTMDLIPTPFGLRPIVTPGTIFQHYKYCPLAAGVWGTEVSRLINHWCTS
jgi:hypothetical protein